MRYIKTIKVLWKKENCTITSLSLSRTRSFWLRNTFRFETFLSFWALKWWHKYVSEPFAEKKMTLFIICDRIKPSDFYLVCTVKSMSSPPLCSVQRLSRVLRLWERSASSSWLDDVVILRVRLWAKGFGSAPCRVNRFSFHVSVIILFSCWWWRYF